MSHVLLFEMNKKLYFITYTLTSIERKLKIKFVPFLYIYNDQYVSFLFKCNFIF